MNAKQKQRMLWIGCAAGALLLALGLILFALRQNISLYFTPTQIHQGLAPVSQSIRVGGLVKAGTWKNSSELRNEFVLTDTAQDVTVHFQGLLPDLFREGQGVVAEGKLDQHGQLRAETVLAKHDERYMPKEVKAAIEAAQSSKITVNNARDS